MNTVVSQNSTDAAIAAQPAFVLRSPHHGPGQMAVTKRSGEREAVDLNKIVRAISRCAEGLIDVDPMRVAVKTITGLFDGASTRALDELATRTAASLIAEEPEYSQLAARLLNNYIDKEVQLGGVFSFSQSIRLGFDLGIVSERLLAFVENHARKLNLAINLKYTDRFEYFGLRTLYDRYLLKHPSKRTVIESPQYFWMRIACALGESVAEALTLYETFASLDYLPSSPTLFNAGTRHEQLSSCFLLDSPEDSLDAIYDKYKDIAQLSKFAGGIGVAWHRVRAEGSLIRGTNGLSNGIVPWLKTLDASVAAVNQGGKRKGAACVYLESWHADIEAFLELRDNTGDEARRTHHLNLANWVPDLFMERVAQDASWSLFDPQLVPNLVDLYGADFAHAYEQAEALGLAKKQVSARGLYARMMRTLAQTGNGWMIFKDKCNRACNQTALATNRVHLSNLCTEIVEVTSSQQTAVCNLGSINLSQHVQGKSFDFEKLAHTVRIAIGQLDRVIDINFYPITTARNSNLRWRPVGLGVMGFQDVLFKLQLPFDSVSALRLSTEIAEEIYYTALCASMELAQIKGAHPEFAATRAARGELQFDAWDVQPKNLQRWQNLRQDIQRYGLRNSLMIAIAPTATIGSIAGVQECIEPQVSNLFKRETLSGDFVQLNRYLVRELKAMGLWSEQIRVQLLAGEGSVQAIDVLPAELKAIYRTAWELPQKALIDMAAARGAFIDQSQSLNLFIENPTIGQLSSMYMYAWQQGLKSTYYLRSRPATKIARTNAVPMSDLGAESAVSCSLENPAACEACQ